MRKVLTAAVVTVLLVAVSVSAQVPSKPFNVYLGGGLSVPTGDLSNGWKTGYNLSGRLGIPAAPKLEFLLGADYYGFPLDKKGLPISGGTFTSLNLAADLLLNLCVPGAPVKPYILGGAGLAVIDITDLSGGAASLIITSETKFFFELGAGVKMGRMFLHAKYVSISATGATISYIPISVGMYF